MVTCQSANQLKTPAEVSWAFKMVSQFGSLGYTIMGKTADLTVVQKTIIDTLKKKKNWTVALWSKVLFSDESKFCISFGNQGPRVWRKGREAHRPSCLKSSVKFHSLWWFGVQCHLLVLVHYVFWKPTSLHPFTKQSWSTFILPSADQLFKDADFIFQQDFGTWPHCQKHQKLVKWPWCLCAWLAS